MVVMYAVLIPLLVLLGFLFYFTADEGLGILMWCLSAFFLLFYLLMYWLTPKFAVAAAKQNPAMRLGITNYFSFDNAYLYMRSVSGTGVDSVSTLPGSVLAKAMETQTHFFLYPNLVTAYILPKKDFVSGTPDGLRAILQSWLPPKKYKRYGKK
ncbi:MAG: hypothetical protein LBL66_02040 [Clostridiales bacterium]|nr:hypothetical protein [Clostridiales bacterium]